MLSTIVDFSGRKKPRVYVAVQIGYLAGGDDDAYFTAPEQGKALLSAPKISITDEP